MRWLAILIATAAVPLCLEGELLPIRSYTTADGLAADRINGIVVDSHGFVWFCTPEGLSRFDGYRMVSFGAAGGLPHPVQAVLETSSGAYLVGTAHGLSEFHAEGGESAFATYLPGNNPHETFVTALMQDSGGRIWCGTDGGIFEMLSGHKFRQHRLPPLHGWDRLPIADILEDAGHKLWLATVTGIYVIAKDGSFQHIGAEDGLPNDRVEALWLDRYGKVWAATRGGLALMRDGSESGRCGVQQVYRDITGLRLNVTALADGPDGAIWGGTTVGIVRSLPGSPGVFRVLTRAQGLIDPDPLTRIQRPLHNVKKDSKISFAVGGKSMAKCVRCGAETILYVNGVPVCVPCDDNKTSSQTAKKEPRPELAGRPVEMVKQQSS
jgi:ligand-binding sensor domain-containing protein